MFIWFTLIISLFAEIILLKWSGQIIYSDFYFTLLERQLLHLGPALSGWSVTPSPPDTKAAANNLWKWELSGLYSQAVRVVHGALLGPIPIKSPGSAKRLEQAKDNSFWWRQCVQCLPGGHRPTDWSWAL